jgi:hypothetical protein
VIELIYFCRAAASSNNPDILQVGMHVTDGKIYVIQNLKSNCASELIAADIIPFGSYD